MYKNENINSDIDKNFYSLYSKIFQINNRLETRNKLFELATKISQFTKAESECFTGELFVGSNCLPAEGPSAIFICNQTQGGFVCDQEVQRFNCPAGSDTSKYGCSMYANDNVDCPKEVGHDCKDVFVFDCSTFRCKGNEQQTFVCDGKSDFLCMGIEFQCAGKSHECVAGHIFQCSNEFTCTKNHDCSGGKTCETPNQVGYICNGNYDRNGDEAPGDFICGWYQDGKGGTFNCQDEFKCIATKDQFQCEAGNSKFECGDNKNKDDFKCKSNEKFQCDNSFNCRSTVNCNNESTTYTGCSKTYTKCPSSTEKECIVFSQKPDPPQP
ncbi:MAG: hypothetical protein LBE12_09195 [Planctomycetaceae bacterium]|jgi:hypothetical protein|nr:hypothetical protein [Planctomycetaceae bacterium]